MKLGQLQKMGIVGLTKLMCIILFLSRWSPKLKKFFAAKMFHYWAKDYIKLVYEFDPQLRQTVNKITVVLPSYGCEYFWQRGGCQMCGFNNEIKRYDIREWPPRTVEIWIKAILLAVGYVFNQINCSKSVVVWIFNAGSFFNEREFLPAWQKAVWRFCRDHKVNKVVVESRPEYVLEFRENIKQAKSFLGEVNLGVNIGLESADDGIREKYIKKGFSRQQYQQAVNWLKLMGVRVGSYILAGAPYLSSQEICHSVVNSARWAWQAGSDDVHLEVYCVQSNTAWEKLYRQRKLELLSLWDIVYIVRQLENISSNWTLGGFSDWPPPIAAPTSCPKCAPFLKSALNFIRERHNLQPLTKISCFCYNQKEDKTMSEKQRPEAKIIYRSAVLKDIPQLVDLEQRVWGPEMAAGEDIWRSRINIFPEGVIIAEKEGQIVGVAVSLLVKWKYPEGYYPSWAEVSANGYITNHAPDGDVMYGVNITAGLDDGAVAVGLLHHSIRLRLSLRQVKRGLVGARIPSLKKRFSFCKPTKEQVIQIAPSDPLVKFFLANGFKLLDVREDYFPPDQDSWGWGAILEFVHHPSIGLEDI